MRVCLLPLRFHFAARDTLRFPASAANLLRGVLGSELRRRHPDAYRRLFAPRAEEGPSGLADLPRPFVLRAEHLNGQVFAPGQTFHFDFRLFDLREPWLPALRDAFAALHGAELTGVSGADAPMILPLDPPADPVQRVRVEFLTPTELKAGGGLAQRPEFHVLAARIRDRISTLLRYYGEGPLAIDFAEFGARAAAIRMTECRLRQVEVRRRSRATAQRHSLGGFVGQACYEGDLTEFFPYLAAAQWTGAGRQTSWGKGAVAVHTVSMV